jgi:hypothetical protein
LSGKTLSALPAGDDGDSDSRSAIPGEGQENPGVLKQESLNPTDAAFPSQPLSHACHSCVFAFFLPEQLTPKSIGQEPENKNPQPTAADESDPDSTNLEPRSPAGDAVHSLTTFLDRIAYPQRTQLARFLTNV